MTHATPYDDQEANMQSQGLLGVSHSGAARIGYLQCLSDQEQYRAAVATLVRDVKVCLAANAITYTLAPALAAVQAASNEQEA